MTKDYYSGYAEDYSASLPPDNAGHAAEIQKAITLIREKQYNNAKTILIPAYTANPDNPEIPHLLGLIEQQNNRNDAALPLLKKARSMNPGNFRYNASLARFYEKNGKLQDATGWYLKTIEINDKYLTGFLQLGAIFVKTGKYRAAVPILSRAIALNGAFAAAYGLLGRAYSGLNRHEHAVACYRKGLDLAPNDISLLVNLCDSLKYLGMISGAKDILDSIIKMQPDSVSPYSAVSEIEKFQPGNPIFNRLEKFRDSPELCNEDRAKACFALGRLHAKNSNWDESFRNFYKGHDFRRQEQGAFDIDDFQAWLARLKQEFGRQFFENRHGFGINTKKPIFIVGCARSGTSLVEQILASHPLVFGGGEMPIMAEIIKRHFNERPSPADITHDKVMAASREYLEYIDEFSKNAGYVTDKMPYNQLNLWLIRLMFPDAAIIHCVRDPIDTCFSCYTQLFLSGHEFTNDLAVLGRFYVLYEKLMDHWKSVIPERIMDVVYESLVENPQPVIAGILEHCGLDWDEKCRKFYETDRSVYTASRLQVRQDIYKTAIGRWRPYEKHLRPLMESLK
jgi:Flp pilus assembly protein TadD